MAWDSNSIKTFPWFKACESFKWKHPAITSKLLMESLICSTIINYTNQGYNILAQYKTVVMFYNNNFNNNVFHDSKLQIF